MPETAKDADGSNGQGWSKAACLKSIEDCADDLGESPSQSQYEEWRGPLRPSLRAIHDRVGWNAAKRELGLRVFEIGDAHPNWRLVGKKRSEIDGY